MNKKHLFTLLILLLGTFPALSMAGGGHDHDHGHQHDEQHEDEPEKGPHGGRIFSEGDFAVELVIFEEGVPPQYRLFAYNDNEPVDPKEVKALVKIDRPLRGSDTFNLTAKDSYLTSDKTVEEPHSFRVEITAEHKGKSYKWNFESFEGYTALSDEALKIADLKIETVQLQKIHSTTEVFGRILPDEDRLAHIYPRFPGVIKEIRVKLGSIVEKGDILAVIESNQSLQTYEIRSLIPGTVVKRHASLGEFAPEGKELFIVADLSEVWADFQVYRDDFIDVTVGQQISIITETKEEPIVAKVSYVSPLTDVATQSRLIRATLSNQNKTLRPGLFISGVLSSDSIEAPIAVKREALQTFRDWNVVFITDGHVFQAVPVELGKQDQEYVEIRSGLKSGDRYVSGNSFIIKADIEKSGASHDH